MKHPDSWRVDVAVDMLRRAADDAQQAAFETDSPHERGVLLASSVSMRWRAGYAERAIADARGFADRTDVDVEMRARLARLADAMRAFEEDSR